MNQGEFETRFQTWQSSLGTGKDPAYSGEIDWKTIGHSALDKRFTELVELFGASTFEQQQRIRDYFGDQEDLLWNLVLYVRRVAKLINTREDIGWLWAGLVIASVENGRVDSRDTLASLVILRFAAKRVGINPNPYFDEIIKISPPPGRERLISGRDHPSWDAKGIINYFGPEEWRKPWWKFW